MFVYQVPEYWLFADGKVWVVRSVTGEVKSTQGVVVVEEILAVISQLDLVVVITGLVRQNGIQDQVNLLAGIRAPLSIFPVLNMKILLSATWTCSNNPACHCMSIMLGEELAKVWELSEMTNNIYIRYLVEFSYK